MASITLPDNMIRENNVAKQGFDGQVPVKKPKTRKYAPKVRTGCITW
jgi:hypothetical protein